MIIGLAVTLAGLGAFFCCVAAANHDTEALIPGVLCGAGSLALWWYVIP